MMRPGADATEEDRIEWIVDGIMRTIEAAESKTTVVQSRDGPVDKPASDYATALKGYQLIAHLWGLLSKGSTRGKSAMASGDDADPEKMGSLSRLFGDGVGEDQ